MKRGELKLLTILLLSSLLSIRFSLNAQVSFDNDGGDLLWSTPSNWSSNTLPGPADSVIISGYRVNVNSVQSVRALTLVPTSSNTRLTVENGTLNISEDISTTMSSNDNITDIIIDNNGILNVDGNIQFTRTAGNTNGATTRILNQSNGDLNVVGNITFNYQGAHTESNPELQFESTSTTDIGGDIIYECSGDIENSMRGYIADFARLAIGGSLFFTQTNGNNIYFEVLDNASMTISDDIVIDISNDADNQSFIEADGANASIAVGDSILITQAAGDDIELRAYNGADFSIGASILSTKTGGDDLRIEVLTGSSFSVTGDITETMAADTVGTDNLTVQVSESTFSARDITLTCLAPDTTDGVLNIVINGSTFNANSITFNQNGGGLGDAYFYVNTSDQSITSKVTITNDFIINHTGGDNIFFRIFDNSEVSVGGNHSITSTSSDSDDIQYLWRGDDASLSIAGDFSYEINGIQSGENFDIDMDADFHFSCDDFILDMNGGQDFTFDMGPNNLGDGGTAIISDSLIIDHEGGSDDIYFRLHTNSNDNTLRIGTIYAEVDANGGDFIEFETNESQDSLIVTNDWYIKSSGGAADTDDDIIIDINGGFVNIGGKAHFEMDGGDIINFQCYNSTFNVTENLNLLLINGDDFAMIIDNSNVIIGDSLVMEINTVEDVGNVVDNNSVLNIGSSFLMNAQGGGVTTRVGEDGLNSSLVTIGEDFVVRNNITDYTRVYQYFGSKMTIGNDYLVTHTCNGSGDYYLHYMDAMDDTLTVGSDLIWTMSGGVNNSEDDLRLQMYAGLLTTGGDASITSTGGDDIDVIMQGGYAKIDGLFELTSTSDARLSLNNDSLIISETSTFTINNGTSHDIDIDGGNHFFGDDITIISNNADGAINFDQDGGTVNAMQDFTFVSNGGTALNLHLDSSTMLISDSLIFDLDVASNETRVYLDENGGSNSFLTASNIHIDHEGDAHDTRFITNENSKIEITNNVNAEWIADDGDFFEMRMDGPSDTIIIGNDLLVNFSAGSQNNTDEPRIYNYGDGHLSIGNDVDINVTDGSTVLLSNTSTGSIDVGNDFSIESYNSHGYYADINNGNISIGNDFTVYMQSQTNETDSGWDMDGGTATIGRKMWFEGDSIRRFYISLNNNSVMNIADSLVFDIDSARARNFTNIENDASLTIGSSFKINGNSTAEEFRLYLNNNGYVNITNDFVANWNSQDFFEIESGLNDNDSLIIGNNLSITNSNGTSPDNADLYFDVKGGLVDIGNDCNYSSNGADNVMFFISGGDINIGNELSLLNTNGGQVAFNMDAGTVDVTSDITFSQTDCNARFNFDQDGGVVTTLSDVNIYLNGTTDPDLRIDNGATIVVTDSIILNLIESDNIFEFYLDDDAGTGSSLTVGSSFYATREANFQSLLVKLEGDSKLDINENFHATSASANADYIEIELNESTDSLIIGNDLIMTMTSGSNNDADDLRLDINDGVALIGNDVSFSNTGGADSRIEMQDGVLDIGNDLTLTTTNAYEVYLLFNDGDIDIAGNMLLTNTSSRDITVNMDAGTLDILGDVSITQNSAIANYDINWDQDGGILTASNDFYVLANDNDLTDFTIDNGAMFNVMDSLSVDLDQSTENFRFMLGIASGAEASIGSHFYIDHEADAQDSRVYLNNGSKLTIGEDFTIINDASGGDQALIDIFTQNDTLIVGNDLIMTIPSGSDHTSDNVDIDVSGGLLQVGNDLLMSNTNGGTIIFDHENATIATTSVGRYMSLISNNSDNIYLNIDGGNIIVQDDITIQHINCDGNFSWNQDGGIVTTNSDLLLIHDGLNAADIRMDNGSALVISDSLILDLNTSNSNFEFYLEEDNGTGSYIGVGNAFFIDHEGAYGDFNFKLEGDAKLDITDDFVAEHDADGGDYIQILLDENNGSDTLLVGGDINFSMLSGSGNGDDDIRIDFDGGYVEVDGDVTLSGDGNGDDIYIYQNGNSAVYFKGDVTFNATDIDDALWYMNDFGMTTVDGDITINATRSDLSEILFGGTSSTVNGNVLIDGNDSPHTGNSIFEYNGGTNELVGTLEVSVESPTSPDADALVHFADGVNTLRSNVIVTANNDADNAEIQVDGGTSIIEDSLILNVTNNSDNPILDINGGTLTINEDIYNNHNASVNLNYDQDGGVLNVLDDFIYTGTDVERHYIRLDKGSELNVTDTLFFDLNDATNQFEFYMEDGTGTSSKITSGTFYIDHEGDAHDMLMRLEGEAVMEIAGDFFIDNSAANGDYFELELNTNDTVIVGGSMIINNYGDTNGSDLNLDINNGYISIADDLSLYQAPISGNNQEIRIQLEYDSHLEVGDSLLVDFDRGANLEFYLNVYNGDDALVEADVIDLDIEENINDARLLLRGENSKVKTSGDFNYIFNAADGDYLQIEMTGVTNTDSIIVGNNFNVYFNNTGSPTNGNNDVRIDMNGGNISVGNDFNMDFIAGNDWETTLDGGASFIVGHDLIMNKDAADEMYIFAGRNSGSGSIIIGNNLDMDHQGVANSAIEIELNNASELDVDGDLNFITTEDNDLLIDLDDASEFRIAGAIDRAVNGNEYGSIISETTAIVTYDGTVAQIMEEEAGGGNDEIQYGIVRINNSSGLLPAVTLENNLGGSADIYGLYMDEGQLDLNGQTLTVLDGNSSAVTRTLGSVLSEQTDNSSILRWVIDANTGAHIFPFGSAAGEYIPFTFNLTSGSAGNVDLATYGTPSDNTPFSPTVTHMNNYGDDNTLFCSDRHWQIETSGSPTANITFPYLDSENAAPNTINEAALQAQRWNGSDWDSPVGTVNTGNKTVTVLGVTTFSPWVLVSSNSPLPVSFIDLSATLENEEVLVRWITGTEENNSHFNILRSHDGVNFEIIGTVEGSGNSTKVLEYYFIDQEPLKGYSYYKVEQVDFDGKSSSTDLVVVSNLDDKKVYFYPNPTLGRIQFSSEAEYVVYDLFGIEVQKGLGTSCDISDVKPGVYLISLNGHISRVVKE